MHSSDDYFRNIAYIDEILAGGLPEMMPLMRRLYPICRSITGPGVRETLDIIGEHAPASAGACAQRHAVLRLDCSR